MENKRIGEPQAEIWNIETYGDLKSIITELALWENTKAIKGIVHDRDKKENGEPVEPHIHMVLRLKQHRYRSTIKNKIQKVNNGQYVNCDKTLNLRKSIRYLRHLDNPDKIQYEESEIQSYGDLEEEDDNVYYRIFEDMIKGIRPRNLLKTYGKDYVRNYTQLRDIIEADRDWKLKDDYRKRIEEETKKAIEELEVIEEQSTIFDPK